MRAPEAPSGCPSATAPPLTLTRSVSTPRSREDCTATDAKASLISMQEVAEREGIDLGTSYAYSDSESDLPMLRAVGHAVVVNPDAALRRIAGEEGWEVVELDRLGRRLKVAAAVGAGTVVASAGRMFLRRSAANA